MGGQKPEKAKKHICTGLLAHVDAGKTTLSEGMLYISGQIKKMGRVDHQNAFLDTENLERERGITIFSKQALFTVGDTSVTLLDTPGHVDFSSEMERTLQVLDCAVLVVSGTDGVQGHTLTLWKLLERNHIPTFLFVNKMDLPGADRQALLAGLQRRLSEAIVDFGQDWDVLAETVALCDEDALACYLDTGSISDSSIASLVAGRKVFPCYFGSALKLEGVEELLKGLDRFTLLPQYPAEFGAKVFKIARDPQGNRLTYLKVTGGTLKVKDALAGGQEEKRGQDASWEEKADQLRLYSGARYQLVEEAGAGTVCAVTGLSKTFPGQGLGAEPPSPLPLLEPVLTCQVLLPEGVSVYSALETLRTVEEEDPLLRVAWNEQLAEIHIQLMGEVQLEILQRLLSERFGLEVSFGPGNIVYRETIAAPVEGVGHFEPLRHYAEVHLLLEPLPRGSGLQFDSICSEDILERNWQRLILTHLEEKEHLGVLTGSPITDMRISLVTGKAHLKHTEGGDFRQATYRAVRQGLKSTESILLEPYYDFELEVPQESLGRAISDLERMDAVWELGEASSAPDRESPALLTGSAPVSSMGGYASLVTSYTKGRGSLSCTVKGYEPCHNAQEVIASIGYDFDRDLDNPADSVFCAHGAGFTVKWDKVPEHMHLPTPKPVAQLLAGTEGGSGQAAPSDEPSPSSNRQTARLPSLEEDKQLAAIFERTYGPSRRPELLYRRPQAYETPEAELFLGEPGTEYLLVDGYNIIHDWEELSALARDNLDAARQALMDILCNYQGFRQCTLILVFDAYKVPRGLGEVTKYHNIHVVFTKEAETADMYIEKTTYDLAKKLATQEERRKIRVATSDAAEQLIILGHGALRISARAFEEEVKRVGGQISAVIEHINSRKFPLNPIAERFPTTGGKDRPFKKGPVS